MFHEDDVADHPHTGGEGKRCGVCNRPRKDCRARVLPSGAQLVLCDDCAEDDHRVREAERRARALVDR